MKRIYISDLDGTLLKNDATLSDYSRGELAKLLENNVAFTIASARSVVRMQEILGDLPLRLPVIEFNGAYISDFKTGTHETINAIDASITPELLSGITRHGHAPLVSGFDGKDDCLWYQEVMNEGVAWVVGEVGDKRLRKTGYLRSVLDADIVCFTVIDRWEKLSPLVSELEDKYSNRLGIRFGENRYSAGWYWLTLHDKKATKDQAIRLLLDQLGLTRHNLTVFGDDTNDISMFKMASRAIAVTNADDQLKQWATDTIGTNEEDSVVKYIIDDLSNHGDKC